MYEESDIVQEMNFELVSKYPPIVNEGPHNVNYYSSNQKSYIGASLNLSRSSQNVTATLL